MTCARIEPTSALLGFYRLVSARANCVNALPFNSLFFSCAFIPQYGIRCPSNTSPSFIMSQHKNSSPRVESLLSRRPVQTCLLIVLLLIAIIGPLNPAYITFRVVSNYPLCMRASSVGRQMWVLFFFRSLWERYRLYSYSYVVPHNGWNGGHAVDVTTC